MQRLDLAGAQAFLRAGGLVIFPTETVYGLGADARQDAAVAAIYAAKARPSFNPLIVHVGSIDQAAKLAQWSARAQALAEAFWPGPLTLVLPRRSDTGPNKTGPNKTGLSKTGLNKKGLSKIVSAGAATIALRCPGHETARALAAALPLGIAAPSANKSGHLSPTRLAHVEAAFADQPEIGLLTGAAPEPTIGLESTVVDISGSSALILRYGSITAAQLSETLGPVGENQAYLADFSDEQVSSPGQLKRHYAPPLPLLLDQPGAGPGQALLAFGPEVPAATWVYNLSPRGDLAEAAARLFEGLHLLSGTGASAICAMPIPRQDIGIAINDRLARGAVRLGD